MRTSRYGTRYFGSTAAKMWISLPQHFRDSTSYNVFVKNLINAWSGGGGGGGGGFVQIFKCVCFMLQFNSSYAVNNLHVKSVYGSTILFYVISILNLEH